MNHFIAVEHDDLDDETAAEPVAFGLIIIGDEVLNGARVDGHLAAFKRLIGERGHTLARYWLLPDDPDVLIAHLRFSMGRPEPVFVCGGIGATPDDHTRACAAAAAHVELARHPEAVQLIEDRFGAAAYPHRILMAELPAGAELIPNPVNQMPGFTLARHWFLPGFPSMAWPMAEWVLDQQFRRCLPLREVAVLVRGVPESTLIPLMEQLTLAYPELKHFSLPHLGTDPHIRFGFRGRVGLDDALAALCAALDAAQIDYSAAGADGERAR
ncbi:Predicted nucleotide-utilizing enzyme [Allochromatium warmingii]|uniref:Predicted nucleotide-utilizing enzyme n=1 Tax=Allochromatium warmingii TaxID=61595 RepID=A0A1H3BG01_ALLWA|nr:molybdopterin-binding protein [Allochromatium warmingii]SDX40621.1 Predicted nucleotide-utilizing enzyme [Allochromatium warmingii]